MSLPKKKFKALIVDCDGTLIESKRDALPTTEVINAVRKAAKILHVGIATQRPLFYASPLLEYLELSGPSIISGGAQVIDSKSKKIMHEELIDRKDLLKAIKIIKEFKKKYNFKFYIQDNTGKEDIEWNNNDIPQKPIEAAAYSLESEVTDQLKDQLLTIPNLALHKVISWEG